MVRPIGSRASLGGRFPVLAVFSLFGLAVVICTIALLGLQPWEPKESVPSLELPALDAQVGDAVAVPTVGPAVAVVEEAVDPGRAALVSRSGARPTGGEGRESTPAVGPALAVASPAGGGTVPTPESAPQPESPPAEAPSAAPPAPELASVPTPPPSASPDTKTPGGPVPSGTPGFPEEGEEEPGEEKACAGDEYLLVITLPEVEGEAAKILLEHIAADGSAETLELEGDLEDARNLVLQLSSEGGCVEVEVASPAADEESAPIPSS